jgi:Porphobilinogen deaminase, C-terminal domain.
LDSVRIERDVLKQMDGGCHIPLGVYVHKDKNHFYHGFAAYAAGHDQEMKVVQHSSSSNHDMANQLFEKLNA